MADEERKGRKPTAAEQAWQQRRDKSTAAYNERKAAREERRAANTDDPGRAAAAHRAAEMYRARIPVADNGAPAPAAGRNQREPTPGEQAWQQRRDKSTAAYNERKAAREERRAANTDDPGRAADARRAAEMYRARIPVADNGAPAPAAGRNPGVGNGAPAAGGGQADNAAFQAMTADIADLRAELQRVHGELADLKKRQTYTIKFGEDDGSEIDVVTKTAYDTSTHTFKQYKRTIVGVTVKEATNEQIAGETVFVTTPHSLEC